MKRKNGASRRVLGFIKTSEYYDTSKKRAIVESKARRRGAGRKPTEKRKLVRGSVKPDGSWSTVVPV